jgi:hypothetical protein
MATVPAPWRLSPSRGRTPAPTDAEITELEQLWGEFRDAGSGAARDG